MTQRFAYYDCAGRLSLFCSILFLLKFGVIVEQQKVLQSKIEPGSAGIDQNCIYLVSKLSCAQNYYKQNFML